MHDGRDGGGVAFPAGMWNLMLRTSPEPDEAGSGGMTKSGREAQVVRQRLIDPEVCSACLSCLAACPQAAIAVRGRMVAIDPARCQDCGACAPECSTGAIESWRLVLRGGEHSLDEQFGWSRLPADVGP